MAVNIALTETTYFILLSLIRPNHGYGIMLRAEELSQGRVRLAAGTLYGALNTMTEKRWIELLPEEEGSRKKEYRLTDLGLEILEKETIRLRELADKGEAVLKGEL
jgi:DNA-binding PadR family transcriptional regulator